jgi:metallophosphoesterase (TIGR00282 family)
MTFDGRSLPGNPPSIAVLLVGDVFGESGRNMLLRHLPSLKHKFALDLVVVNGENAAGGIGLMPRQAQEIFAAGADVITGGNHTLARQELFPLLQQEPHLLRPANLPPSTPGQGWVITRTRSGEKIAVVNLLGRALMPVPELACPFAALQTLLREELKSIRLIVVDFHAEASSEKQALAWHFDGRVSALIGTHTHVPTADERVLPAGTAYITDAGLTGPYNSVIGMDPDTAIRRFTQKNPTPRFKVAEGPAQLNAVLIHINPATGRARHIERVSGGPE